MIAPICAAVGLPFVAAYGLEQPVSYDPIDVGRRARRIDRGEGRHT